MREQKFPYSKFLEIFYLIHGYLMGNITIDIMAISMEEKYPDEIRLSTFLINNDRQEDIQIYLESIGLLKDDLLHGYNFKTVTHEFIYTNNVDEYFKSQLHKKGNQTLLFQRYTKQKRSN